MPRPNAHRGFGCPGTCSAGRAGRPRACSSSPPYYSVLFAPESCEAAPKLFPTNPACCCPASPRPSRSQPERGGDKSPRTSPNIRPKPWSLSFSRHPLCTRPLPTAQERTSADVQPSASLVDKFDYLTTTTPRKIFRTPIRAIRSQSVGLPTFPSQPCRALRTHRRTHQISAPFATFACHLPQIMFYLNNLQFPPQNSAVFPPSSSQSGDAGDTRRMPVQNSGSFSSPLFTARWGGNAPSDDAETAARRPAAEGRWR